MQNINTNPLVNLLIATISKNVASTTESVEVKNEEPIQHNYTQLTDTRLKVQYEFHAK